MAEDTTGDPPPVRLSALASHMEEEFPEGSTADAAAVPEEADVQHGPIPRRGCLNYMMMLWVFPVVWKGFRNPLEESDVPSLPRNLKSDCTRAKAEAAWDHEHVLRPPKLSSVPQTHSHARTHAPARPGSESVIVDTTFTGEPGHPFS